MKETQVIMIPDAKPVTWLTNDRSYDTLKYDFLYRFQLQLQVKMHGLQILLRNLKISEETERTKYQEELENDSTWNSLSKIDREYYEAQLYEEREFALEEFIRIQKFSVVQTVFSITESTIKELCLLIDQRPNQSLRFSTVTSNNQILWSYWSYLLKTTNLSLESNSTFLCQNLLRHQFVQNSIAHNNGQIVSGQKNKIPKTKGLELISTPDGFIINIVSFDYLDAIVAIADNLLTEIVHDL